MIKSIEIEPLEEFINRACGRSKKRAAEVFGLSTTAIHNRLGSGISVVFYPNSEEPQLGNIINRNGRGHED